VKFRWKKDIKRLIENDKSGRKRKIKKLRRVYEKEKGFYFDVLFVG